MTRLELLTIAVGRARTNGFEFRRWYTSRLELPWISTEAALTLLDQQRRYVALLFAHEFAIAFWKAGEEITFAVPATSFQRHMPDGSIQTVQRKPFTRRSARRSAWLYHLRQMAAAEEPLRYIRKYLNVEDELTGEPIFERPSPAAEEPPAAPPRKTAKTLRMERPKRGPGAPPKPLPRPIPTGTPAFLRRPYYP